MKAKMLATSERHTGLILKMRHVLTVFVAAGIMTMATGCASDHQQRSAGQSIDDQAIARRVQEALSSDPAYKYTDVKVVSYQGKVQLSGFVDKGEQKGQAEDIAKKVPGVKEVRNDITMK
jgi:hyperosmotically inducible periplasmic protein